MLSINPAQQLGDKKKLKQSQPDNREKLVDLFNLSPRFTTRANMGSNVLRRLGDFQVARRQMGFKKIGVHCTLEWGYQTKFSIAELEFSGMILLLLVREITILLCNTSLGKSGKLQ